MILYDFMIFYVGCSSLTLLGVFLGGGSPRSFFLNLDIVVGQDELTKSGPKSEVENHHLKKGR